MVNIFHFHICLRWQCPQDQWHRGAFTSACLVWVHQWSSLSQKNPSHFLKAVSLTSQQGEKAGSCTFSAVRRTISNAFNCVAPTNTIPYSISNTGIERVQNGEFLTVLVDYLWPLLLLLNLIFFFSFCHFISLRIETGREGRLVGGMWHS